MRPRYNLAPTQRAGVVVDSPEGLMLERLRWGLMPFWAKDAKVGRALQRLKTRSRGQRDNAHGPLLQSVTVLSRIEARPAPLSTVRETALKTWRSVQLFALGFALLASSLTMAKGKTGPTFVDVESPAAFSAEDRKLAETLRRSHPSIEWVLPAKVNLEALNFEEFNAFLADELVLIREASPRSEQGPGVWTGLVIYPDDHPDVIRYGERDVDITRLDKGGVAADIRTKEFHYQVGRLRSGRAILIKRDPLRDAPDDSDVQPNPELRDREMRSGAEATFGTLDEIRVVVGFSPWAEAGDQPAFLAAVNTAISRANASFVNSNIALRVVLAANARPDYIESTTGSAVDQAFNDLNAGPSGPLWLVHYARQQEYADVAVMVVGSTTSDVCGKAPVGSTVNTAFMVVKASCLTQQSFTHELGHLLSAHHNPEDIGSIPAAFPYGHGYRWQGYPKPNSTIMAVKQPGGFRRNIWSGPDVTYQGQVTGTATTHHNARVLREKKSTVANFFPPPPAPVPNGAVLYTPNDVIPLD